MIAQPGQAILWNLTPFCGTVMVKGTTDAGLIVLYHMGKDEFFSVSPDDFSQCRTLTFRDESLRASNPAQWEIQSVIWARARQRCGI